MISVIIPYFNAEATLDKAIRCIVEQTYTDWELVLVDNNSTDRGPSIAHEWANRDERIQVIQEDRQGVAFAMNTGLNATRYDLVARMDADDLTHPERLEKQHAFMSKNPDVDVLATRVKFTSTLEHHLGFLHYVEWQNGLLDHDDIYNKRFVDASLVQATTLIRRSAFDRFGIYDTSEVPDDFELWLRWFHSGMRCAKLPDVLYTWQDGLHRLSRSHPDYSPTAFDAIRFKWLSAYLKDEHDNKPVIILGTSKLCRDRANQLEALGIRVEAFSDVSGKSVEGYDFIRPNDLGDSRGVAFIVSMISQRGTGDRISAFLNECGLVEGADFILCA